MTVEPLKKCKKDPCCPKGCVLKPQAGCVLGLCCRDYRFRPVGAECRAQTSECALPERHDATSAECPECVNVFDGGPCKGGICYESRCNTHEGQCQDIFGPEAKSTDDKCY